MINRGTIFEQVPGYTTAWTVPHVTSPFHKVPSMSIFHTYGALPAV